MREKTKRPSAFATSCEVLYFLIDSQHSIPRHHHVNLVDFKGCTKLQFDAYVRYGHQIDEAAILYAIENSRTEVLDILFRFSPFRLTEELKDAYIEKFGYSSYLEKGILLSQKHTLELLNKHDFTVLCKYFNLLLFNEVCTKKLLELHNIELTLNYLKKYHTIDASYSSIILSYNEANVYKTFFKYCKPLREVISGVVLDKSAELFKIMLKSSPQNPCQNSDFKSLIAQNDIKKLKIYVQYYGFDKEMTAYITQFASDEIFALCLLEGSFSDNVAMAYSRLFRPTNRKLLFEYISKNSFNQAKWEIELLRTDDDELIKAYDFSFFKAETIAYILSQNLGKRFNVTYNDVETYDWRAETRIFASQNDRLIEDYLFAGKAYNDGLTEFGEAQLFMHGSIEIIDAYMEEVSPRFLAQQALISRWNRALLNLFFYKHHYMFSPELTPSFLDKADDEFALRYIKSISNPQEFFKKESSASLLVLLNKKDIEIYRFVLGNIVLSDVEQAVFIHNAPIDLVMELIDTTELSLLAEASLLQLKNKQLISSYLIKHKLYPENEDILLKLLDVELVDMVGDNSFVTSSACNSLGL